MIALARSATERLKLTDLVRCLDSLGDRFQVQRIAHHNYRFGYCIAFASLPELVYKGLVDLENVDRESLQIA